jgi:sporulation protein YlmC with PRC-barrel domain
MIYSLVVLNKPAINSDRNEKMGRVKGYVIDPDARRVLAFILAPDAEKGSLDVVPFDSVKRIYDNAVICEGLPAPIPISDRPDLLNVFLKDVALIGSQVITDSGMLAGAVHDFAFDEKTGDLAQLALLPEMPAAKRVSAKYILKITQSRIMIQAEALDDIPPAPEKPGAPGDAAKKVECAPPPPPEPQRPAAVQPAPQEPQFEAPAPAVETPSEVQPEPPTPSSIFDSKDLKDFIKQAFFEMTGMIVERINALDASESIKNLSESLPELMKSAGGARAESDPADELIIEEKIKRALSPHIKEIKADINRILEMASSASAATQAEPPAPPDLSPISKALAAAEASISEKIDAAFDSVPRSDPKDIEAAVGSLARITNALEDLKERIPAKEDIRKQISDYSVRFEERANALNSAFLAELDKQMGAARETISSIERKRSGPDASEIVSKLDERIESAMEDFRDRFAAQLSVELEENFAQKLERSIAAGMREAAEVARSQADNLALQAKSAKEAVAKLAEAQAALPDRLNSALDALRSRLDEVAGRPHPETAGFDADALEARLAERLDRISDGVAAATAETKAGAERALEGLKAAAENIKESVDSRFAERADVWKKYQDDAIGAARRIEERVLELRERNTGLEASFDSARSAILDEVRSYTDTTLKPEDLMIVREWLGEISPKLSDAVALKVDEGIRSAAEEIKRVAENTRGQFDALADSIGLAGENLSGLADQLVAELGKQFDEKMSSMPENGLSRETLEQFKTEIAERVQASADAVRERLDAAARERAEERDILSRRLNEALENAAAGIRESLYAGIEAGRQELAEMKDLERLRDRLEGRIGDVVDDMVGRIENRLDQRDRYYEEGVSSILANVEKLVSRGLKPDLEGMFSGGGLISSLFGQKPAPQKITGKTSPYGGSQPQSASDASLRRFAYLIGKKIKTDIVDPDGSTIAAAGDTVNEALIRSLRDKQRTLDLIRSVDFNA